MLASIVDLVIHLFIYTCKSISVDSLIACTLYTDLFIFSHAVKPST